ncbi:MAG: hypothetical protein RIC15_02960 [Vicingaceae bacterium]
MILTNNYTKGFAVLSAIAVIASCAKKEDKILTSNPSKIFVTVDAQVTADIDGAGDEFITITTFPDSKFATADFSSNRVFVTGVAKGNTSLTVKSESSGDLTIPVTVALRKFDRGAIQLHEDGNYVSSLSYNMFAWDSLGTFFLRGTTPNFVHSIDLEGVRVSGTGTFSIPEGSVRYSNNADNYYNTGTSYDQLTIGEYSSTNLEGSFQVIVKLEGGTAQKTLTMSTFDMDR